MATGTSTWSDTILGTVPCVKSSQGTPNGQGARGASASGCNTVTEDSSRSLSCSLCHTHT